MLASPPRHYLSAAPAVPILPGSGLPQERMARIAARRAFVDMKQRFIDAMAEVEGKRGDWLRYQVRHAQEPVDLWLLRGAVFAALQSHDADTHSTRLDLHRALDSVFPDSGALTPYLPF